MASGQDISVVKQLNDITECSICSERFTDPRSLPCVHSFCLTCIKLFTRDEQPGTKMPCPMCRKEFTIPSGGVSELPKNFFIMRLMQIQQSVSESTPSVCSVCLSDEALGVVQKKAIEYCLECCEKYCEDCARYHKMFKATSSHKRLKLDDCGELRHRAEDMCKASPTFCEKHKDQALSVYCRNCKSPICVICYIAAHKQHDCSDINDVIEEFRNRLATDVLSLADVSGKLHEILTSIEWQKQDFTRTVSEAERKIFEKVEDIKLVIERNRQKLLDELKTKQQHVVTRFDNLGRVLTQHLTVVDNLKKYTEELSKKGAEADIARETSVLHDRVEELLKLDVLLQSRDDMHSTDIKFTASTLFAEECENTIGKIELTIIAKVKKEKPHISVSPDKVEAREKQNVRFQSTITGAPEPIVEWLIAVTELAGEHVVARTGPETVIIGVQYEGHQRVAALAARRHFVTEDILRFKDGVKLTPSSRTVMEKNGNVYTLVMNNVVEQDEGQYTVRATNSEGTTEAVATLKVEVLKPTVPSLTHVIPRGNSYVAGVTSLNNELFVVRHFALQQIEVYDVATFALLRNISVPGLNHTFGFASCAVNNCIYAAEYNSNLVCKVGLLPILDIIRFSSKWSVGQQPFGISTNSANNVLVTCHTGHKVQEYTTHGTLIRDINLSTAGISLPRFAVELPNGHIAVSYDNGVCIVDTNGALIRQHTSTNRSLVKFISPRGFALAQSGCTLMANYGAHQLVLFNPSFTSSRVLSLTNDCAMKGPWTLFLDESRGRLYVGEWDGRRVLVFDNVFNVGTDFRS